MKNYGVPKLFPTAVLIILTASIACSGPNTGTGRLPATDPGPLLPLTS